MANYGMLRRVFYAETVLVFLIFCLNIPIYQWQQVSGEAVFVVLARTILGLSNSKIELTTNAQLPCMVSPVFNQ